MAELFLLIDPRQRRLDALGKRLDAFEQQHLLFKNRLEENNKAWYKAVKEYEALEREISNGKNA